MAEDTPLTDRNLVIYSIYIRSHGPNGTFADVEHDLERIRSMGVDVIWLLPVHPIGIVERKGTLGSPYSILDYRAINSEYGTEEDFRHLIERIHALGMKVMMDVVYNHTSRDSRLLQEHPEWFHQDENGQPFPTVPEWSDVIDLKHPNQDLWAELIDTLLYWVRMGVDGFRCDVAALVPLEFWLQARKATKAANPDIIWLAESVHVSFVRWRHITRMTGLSDSELYRAFDLTYDYDLTPVWQHAVREDIPAKRYLEMLRFQDGIYPANYVKLRFVENHDNPRIQNLAPSFSQAAAWTALAAFNKGAFLIYAGQEAGARQSPSLFEKEPIEWNGYPLQPLLTALARLKKHPELQNGELYWIEAEPAVIGIWDSGDSGLLGVFNVNNHTGRIEIPLPDGIYFDLIRQQDIRVENRSIEIPEDAVILPYNQAITFSSFDSVLG